MAGKICSQGLLVVEDGGMMYLDLSQVPSAGEVKKVTSFQKRSRKVTFFSPLFSSPLHCSTDGITASIQTEQQNPKS